MPPTSASLTSLAFPQSATMHNLTAHGGVHMRSSCTWTTSSDVVGLVNDTDKVDDGTHYVEDYNRLAVKVRMADFWIEKSAVSHEERCC